jgi:biofilm PGA synthesis N-glycosyltransferase PgaC
VRYEPRALAWVAMPETLLGLWRQRVRWARGGFEAALKYRRLLKTWNKRRMWPIYVEYVVSAIWCYAWAFTVLCFLMTLLLPAIWPAELRVESLLPRWTGVVLGVTCLLQFTIGLFLDSHYERGILRNLFWAIWYPAVYWTLSAAATIVAIPKALGPRRTRARYATWKSPERGVR